MPDVENQQRDHRRQRRPVHPPAGNHQRVGQDGQPDQQDRKHELIAVFLGSHQNRAVQSHVHIHDPTQAEEQENVTPAGVRLRHQRKDIVEVDPDDDEQKATGDQVHQRRIARDFAHTFHVALFPQVRNHRRRHLDDRTVGHLHRAGHIDDRGIDPSFRQPADPGQHRLVDDRYDIHRSPSEILPQSVYRRDRKQPAHARSDRNRPEPRLPYRRHINQQDRRRYEIDQHVPHDELLERNQPQRIQRNFDRNQQAQQNLVDERGDDRLVKCLQPRTEKIIGQRSQPQRNQHQVVLGQ